VGSYVDGLVAIVSEEPQARRVGARHGHRWCHLIADTAEELHELARRIGLKREWAQLSRRGLLHYDLTPTKRAAAVKLGAIELDRHAFVTLARKLRGTQTAEVRSA
jgi:hypothetical protein